MTIPFLYLMHISFERKNAIAKEQEGKIVQLAVSMWLHLTVLNLLKWSIIWS